MANENPNTGERTMARRNLSISVYKMDFGEGDGEKWFGGVVENQTNPVADSARLGSAGAFDSRTEAVQWAKERKTELLTVV